MLTGRKELQLKTVYSGKLLEQELYSLRKKSVDWLIDLYLLQAECQKQKIQISNRDIESELDRISEEQNCRSRADWSRKLRENGSSLEQVREDVKKNMMAQVMIQRQRVINGEPSPKELYEYFKKHEKEYTSSEKVGLSMLKINSNRPDLTVVTQDISQALKSPEANFTELVKKYAPEFGSGDLGEIDRNLLRSEFVTALKDISVGKIVGPLKIDDGLVWLKINSYRPAVVADFRVVEKKLREDINRNRYEDMRDKYCQKLRSQAVVEYYF
jgi:parvulin-like peptidyl-prolyl isomerase